MQTRKLGLVLSLSLALLLVAGQALAAMATISLAEVEALVAKSPEDGKYFLFDSRPEIKYFEGHLPWAKSLPWAEMKDRLDELPADKGAKLVFYCGGVKCDLSHKASALATEKGYTDVTVFVEGDPAWKAAGHAVWVSTNYIKMVLNDRDRVALLVDSRPTIKYNEGTVPGALSLPFPEWDKLKGLLPADKATQVIFFCGGFVCDLSPKSAVKARELGYTNVGVYAEGWPAWKEKSTRAFAMVNPKDGGTAAAAAAEPTGYEGEISQAEFLKLLADKPKGFLLVDCRPEADFKKSHLPGAINIQDENVAKNIDLLKKHSQVVFYCATGARSASAYYAAEDAGLKGTKFLNKAVDYTADGSYVIK
ncbi:MAG: sulfurtransferase [Desulfuromonadales bacterium]|nr:sulfurtransferase [Desulfuromonadales bacterium]